MAAIDRLDQPVGPWDIPSPASYSEEEVAQILNQPFYFFGRGGQSYVFLSQDQATVLKLFKRKHPLPDTLVEQIHSLLPERYQPFRLKFLPTRLERLNPLVSSCQLAWTQLKKESGLLYLHFNPTPGKHPPLQLIDCLGITHTLDLDQTAFLLQQKGELIFTRLKKLRLANDFEGAKGSVATMIDYIAERCKAGIRDTDNGIQRNYGYLNAAPLSIDVGSFVFDASLKTPEACRREVLRKTRKLRTWIKENYSELLPEYDAHIEKI